MKSKHLRRRIREPLAVCAVFLLTLVVSTVPLAWLPRLASCVGFLLWAVPSMRRLALANLQTAFPEKPEPERRRIGRAAAGNMVLIFFEFLWFARHPHRLKTLVDTATPDAELLFATSRDHGGFCMTPHCGNWELGAQAIAAHGIPFGAVVRQIKNAYLERLVTRTRTFHGMTLIPEHGAVRAMVKAIREGRSIGILIDQNTRPREGGVFVPFFGLPATASRAPATLALKFGIPIICSAAVREEGRLKFRCEQLPKPLTDYADDVELTRDLILLNERLIRRYPEQYMWFYERWRYLPPDLPPDLRSRYPYYAAEPAGDH